MATPQDEVPQEKSPKHSPRPRRSRKLPGHLVEYEHDLPDPEETESSSSSSSEESETKKKEMKKWKRMEAAWDSVLQTMNEMHITMKETSGALTKRVEQLERAGQSCSPLPTQSDAQQPDRAASLPPLLQTPQHSSVVMSSIHTTDHLHVLAPAERQDIRTPVNLLRPVEPIPSSPPLHHLTKAYPILHSAPNSASLPLSPNFQPAANTQTVPLWPNPVAQPAQQPGAVLVPQPVRHQPPVLQPRENTAFQPAGQSAPWPAPQPVPQLRIPVAYPEIQPALQPVTQVAQSVHFRRLEPSQAESLYSQRYQHPQPQGSSTQVLSARSHDFPTVSASLYQPPPGTSAPQTYSQLYAAPHPDSARYYSAAYPSVSAYPSLPAAYTAQNAVPPAAEATQPNLMEMILASSYGIPKPRLVTFKSGRECDFVLLKKGLDSLLGPHAHLTEEYKYHILIDQLEHPCALQVARR